MSDSPALLALRHVTGYNLRFTKMSYIRNCCIYQELMYIRKCCRFMEHTRTFQAWFGILWCIKCDTDAVHAITIQIALCATLHAVSDLQGSRFPDIWRKLWKRVFWVFFCFATKLCCQLLMSFWSHFLAFFFFTLTWIYLASSLHFDHVEQCLAHKSANKPLAAPDNYRAKLLGIYSCRHCRTRWTFWFSDLATSCCWRLEHEKNPPSKGATATSAAIAEGLQYWVHPNLLNTIVKYVITKWNILRLS